jgi:CheY-like chemotaxis protein
MKKLKRVLVVDDDAISQLLTSTVLGAVGWAESIITAVNGDEAFYLLSQECSTNEQVECWLDLILLDISMPLIGGREFLSACRDMEFKCVPKIALLSSSSHEEEYEIAKEFNLAGTLRKPLSEESFRGFLEKNFAPSSCCQTSGVRYSGLV